MFMSASSEVLFLLRAVGIYVDSGDWNKCFGQKSIIEFPLIRGLEWFYYDFGSSVVKKVLVFKAVKKRHVFTLAKVQPQYRPGYNQYDMRQNLAKRR